MREFARAAVIRPDQLNANQSDVVTAVINEISGSLVLRLSGQLVVIHLPAVLPVHPENVALPHNCALMPNLLD